MRIEIRKIADLSPNDWNPNEMDEVIFRSLIASIRRDGVLQPIVIRPDGTIIKGEKRWRAAQEASLSEVPCLVMDVSDEDAKLLTITLSRLRGKTNEELLTGLLDELSGHFSTDELALLAGFQTDDLDQLLKGLHTDTNIDAAVVDDDFYVQGALDKIREPETRRGDIWKLGRHILMCGDTSDPNDVQRLMAGKRTHLVVTDPPYNVAVKSDSTRLNADGRGQIMNDSMADDQFVTMLHAWFSRYAEIMDPRAAIYVFHPSSYQREFEGAMNGAGIVVRTQCIWVKNAFSFGFAQYKYKHEPIFYAHLKGQAPAWYGDFKQNTVWKAGLPVENPEPATVWEVSRGDVTKYVHPTQKPLDLLAIPIGNSSKRGDIVTDFFGGSGSTLMTCDQMDRECRTMELDPIFCDVIKQRFYESTGIQPILLSQVENAA